MNTNIPSRPTAGHDRGPRVLVVEDDPHSRWALCALFRRLGYDCRAAADGSEALRTVAEFAPRVILMDLMMPGIDGLEATRRLKANAATRPIPIVALTGNVTPSGESAARQAGCDDFVPKPVVFQDLIARVRDRLGQPPDANRAAGPADDRGPRGWHHYGR
jgi:CheY-like chemotaxis protein